MRLIRLPPCHFDIDAPVIDPDTGLYEINRIETAISDFAHYVVGFGGRVTQVEFGERYPLIQIPTQGGKIKITIPKPQADLENLSKGSVSDSITWFAAFWIRMIKKAIHFGWELIGGH